jgi:predicted permease
VLREVRERLARLAAAFRRSRLDDELREEIAQHIDHRRRQLIADGVEPRNALALARKQFGNVSQIREESRVMWSIPPPDTVVQDLRYGARMIRRSPAVAAIAVISLGLGIGSAAAVFGLAEALLVRELPVHAPEQLALFRWSSGPVSVFESLNGNTHRDERDFSMSSSSFSRPAFDALRRELSGRADVFGFAELYRVNLFVDGRADVGTGYVVSGNYYSALGLSASAGRLIADADDRNDAPPVAVVSHAFAERRLGGATAVGRQLTLNGMPFTIVGVAPAGFRGTLQVGQEHDVIVPMASYDTVNRAGESRSPNYWWVLMMARLSPGMKPADVQAAADLVVKRTTSEARPQLTPRDLPRVSAEPGSRGQTENRDAVREPLTTMALVIAIVLLVACATVANLRRARGRARVRELTIRVAIGAGRARVVRQLMTEGLVLALAGGALGLVLAKFIAAALLPALTGAPSVLDDAGLYWRVAGFTLAAAVGSTLLFGVVPALRATDVRLASGLQEATRSATGERQRNPLAGTLVIVQVALSTLLVTAAALLVVSLRSLERVDPGFDAESVLVFRIDPRQNGYEPPRVRELVEGALERLRRIPGVRAASFSSHPLIAGASDVTAARPAGTAAPAPGTAEAQQFIAEHRAWRLVTDDAFLETMGIGLRAGRPLRASDSETAQPVAVVNESLARQLFGTGDAVGRQMVLGLGTNSPPIEIVGVSADAKYTSMRRPAPPTFYMSYRQRATWGSTFVVRTELEPAAIVDQVRAALREVDPSLPLSNLRTQREQIRMSLQRERLFAQLATLLGGATLLLAMIGLYGLLAYSVTRRTPELGLRMALGAGRGTVKWMVLEQSLVLVGAGLVIGVPAAIAGNRVVSSLLFDIRPSSPLPLVVAAGITLVVSFVAAFVPAHRASRVEPVVALRAE